LFGSDLLNNALNVAPITDLLDVYMSGKALFQGTLIPQDFTLDKSINIYMSGIYNAALEYDQYLYNISCRDKTETGSKTIAGAVITEINRVHYPDYYIVCSVLETIPPQDQTDNYNTPIEATIKAR
jgi:hypothetical protein